MHTTYDGALHSARLALEDFGTVFEELPDSSLDWTPVAGANSFTVLVRHSVTATKFLASAAAGLNPDRASYLATDRAEAFRARGATAHDLMAEIQMLRGTLGEILAHGGDESLASPASWAWPDGRYPIGAELLVHTIGHLREHTGQAQLMRDIWLAASREGR